MADNTLPCYAFVYGTLKRGYGNYDRILKNTSQFIGTATTLQKYDMLDSGFPVIMPNENGYPVKGEVFLVTQIPVLEDLDRLEGEGSMYDRKEISVEVTQPDGKAVELQVQVYIGCPAWQRRRRTNLFWLSADGEWVWDLAKTHHSFYEEERG